MRLQLCALALLFAVAAVHAAPSSADLYQDLDLATDVADQTNDQAADLGDGDYDEDDDDGDDDDDDDELADAADDLADVEDDSEELADLDNDADDDDDDDDDDDEDDDLALETDGDEEGDVSLDDDDDEDEDEEAGVALQSSAAEANEFRRIPIRWWRIRRWSKRLRGYRALASWAHYIRVRRRIRYLGYRGNRLHLYLYVKAQLGSFWYRRRAVCGGRLRSRYARACNVYNDYVRALRYRRRG